MRDITLSSWRVQFLLDVLPSKVSKIINNFPLQISPSCRLTHSSQAGGREEEREIRVEEGGFLTLALAPGTNIRTIFGSLPQSLSLK